MKGMRDINIEKMRIIQLSGVTGRPWLLLNIKFGNVCTASNVSAISKAIMEKLH